MARIKKRIKTVDLFILFLFITVMPLYANDRTIEISGKALQQEEKSYAVMMDNVSNAKTPGYREVRSYTRRAPDGSIESDTFVSQHQGHFIHTGRSLDFAIEGDGFFVVQGTHDYLYTRDGRFTVDEHKRLCTYSGGYPLIGENGPIIYDDTFDTIQITETGKLIQNGIVIDRIQIAFFKETDNLKSVNGAFFYLPVNSLALPEIREDFTLKVGYVEGSNINLSKQMVQIPVIQKAYDANSRALQLRLKAMGSSLEMGKVQ